MASTLFETIRTSKNIKSTLITPCLTQQRCLFMSHLSWPRKHGCLRQEGRKAERQKRKRERERDG